MLEYDSWDAMTAGSDGWVVRKSSIVPSRGCRRAFGR